MGEDSTAPQSGRRVTVDEAARHLGLSVDAIRKRVQRGQIAHERDQAGRVRIILDESETIHDEGPDTTGLGQSPLLEAKDETITLLRQQLESERQAHAEARRLLAAALERIPLQIEPPSEAPGGPETATEQPGRVEPQPSVTGAQEPAERRSWWRRMFGG